MPVINQNKIELTQMQLLERESFKKHTNALLEEYEIKATTGTVDIDYQNIPFFSAYDVSDDEKLNILKRITDNEISAVRVVDSLAESLSDVFPIDELIRSL